MRYTFRIYAGLKHPAKVPFGLKLSESVVRGETGRQQKIADLRGYIAKGHISSIKIFDRNNTLVEEITNV